MNYQCSNEFILALIDIAQICEENNTDNLRLSFDISDNREFRVYISFEVKENNDDKKPTNADRIRSMSDEELAMNMMCPNENGLGEIECDKSDNCNCYECLLKWLQSEVEE